MKRLFLFLMVLIGFSSIASAQKTEVKVDYMELSARYLEPTQSIMTTPLIADLSVVGGQFSYTETEAFKDYEVTDALIDLVPSFKNIALCHAARAHKADMRIGAMVDVITTNKGRLEITITGYPARYVNFKRQLFFYFLRLVQKYSDYLEYAISQYLALTLLSWQQHTSDKYEHVLLHHWLHYLHNGTFQNSPLSI